MITATDRIGRAAAALELLWPIVCARSITVSAAVSMALALADSLPGANFVRGSSASN